MDSKIGMKWHEQCTDLYCLQLSKYNFKTAKSAAKKSKLMGKLHPTVQMTTVQCSELADRHSHPQVALVTRQTMKPVGLVMFVVSCCFHKFLTDASCYGWWYWLTHVDSWYFPWSKVIPNKPGSTSTLHSSDRPRSLQTWSYHARKVISIAWPCRLLIRISNQ